MAGTGTRVAGPGLQLRIVALAAALGLHGLVLALWLMVGGDGAPAARADGRERLAVVVLPPDARRRDPPAAPAPAPESPSSRPAPAVGDSGQLQVPDPQPAAAVMPVALSLPVLGAGPKPIEPAAPVAAPPSVEAGRAPASDALAAWQAAVWRQVVLHRPAAVYASGSVTLRFRLDRQGAVGAVAVERSSGEPRLDRLAVLAVRRASPFPAPPAGVAEAALDVVVAVNFR